jgi:hypothetical protein
MSNYIVRLPSQQNYNVISAGTVAPIRFTQLVDVNMDGVADGNLVSYAASTGTFVPTGTASYSIYSGIATSVVGGYGDISYLNVSGISTLNYLFSQDVVVTGSITSPIFIGDLLGTASFATTAYTLNGVFPEDLHVAYADVSGISTYAISSGISTYATLAGIATYAINAGIATYSGNSGIATYAPKAGIATYAVSSGISTYATNSGISTYAVNSGIATYAVSSGISTYATNSGISIYSTNSGIATYAVNSGIATYAINSGISTYAVNAGIASYATKAGIATYSPNAGISTYAVNAGIATYSGSSGISTYAINSGVSTYAISSGISTYAVNAGIATYSGSSGISTYAVNAGIATYSTISGIATYAASSGISTYAVNAGIATYSTISGIATYAASSGISTYSVNAGIATYAVSSGIATYAVNSGIATYSTISGIATYAVSSGIATYSAVSGVATALQNSRTFEITGDIIASPISFNGTGNVSLAATIQPNSVELGTDTTGDYIKNITGTPNQIAIVGGTGEGSISTISIAPNPFLNGNVTVQNDLQVNNNLNVSGNITIGGTAAYIISNDFRVKDADIVVGFTTDSNGNDVSNDTTANHGGIAVASTEGSPLVELYNPGVGETTPATYKKIMWFKTGSFVGLNTDAWLINYAVGIGSTQVPYGTRLAVGGVQITDNDIQQIRNINASGITTSYSFRPSSGYIQAADGTNSFYIYNGTGNVAFQGNINVGQINSGSGYKVITLTTNDASFENNVYISGVTTSVGGFVGNLTGTATTATNLTNASNIITGTINSSRLSGNYNINVSYASTSGISTYATSSGVSTSVIGGIGSLGSLIVSGVSTLGITSITNLIASNISVSGVITSSNFVGNLTGTATTATYSTSAGIATYANTSGIATYAVSSGISTYATSAGIATYSTTSGIATYASTAGISTVAQGLTGTPDINVGIITSSRLVVNDGGTFTGIVTASTFVGNLTGTATTSTYAVSSGIATYAVNAGIATYAVSSGIATYAVNAGIATYAVSSGIATYAANAGIATYAVSSGIATYASTAGISTVAQGLTGTPNVILGIATASTFVGNLTGTATTSINVIGGIGSISQLQVTGISTFTNGPILVGTAASTGTASQTLQVTGGAYVSGNIGIGTTNPTSRLTVSGNTLITGITTVNSNLVVNGNTLFVDATSNRVGILTTSPFQPFQVGVGNSVVVIDSMGDIGIGTTNPLYRLQIGSLNSSGVSTDGNIVAVTGIGSVGIGTANPRTKLQVNGDLTLDDGSTYSTSIQIVTPTANRTISFPDATGNVALVSGISGQLIYNLSGAYSGYTNSGVDTSGNITFSGRLINSVNGAASAPPVSLTGTWFSGGTSTTTKPQLLVEPTSTTSTSWSTNGTGLGINAASGFTGRLLDLQLNGTSNFNVDSTGRLSVPLGTAALPSIYPGTNTNTGFWSPATNTLAASTNGTEAIRILSNQSVGIGTTNPANKLDVFTSGSSNFIRSFTDLTSGFSVYALQNTGASGRTYHFGLGGNGVSGAQGGGVYLFDSTASSVRWVTDSSGNFIIGSTSATGTASQPLQVTGGAYLSGSLGIGITTPGHPLHVVGSSRIGTLSASRSTSGLSVGFTTNVTFAANSDVGDQVRILSLVNESTTTNAMSVLGFRVNPNVGAANAMLDMKFVQTGATNTSALHYTFNHGGSFVDRFTLLSSGNVGIGTIAPQSTLQVKDALAFETTNTTTTSTSQVSIDSFSATVFRSAKYQAQITCPGQISTLGGITTGGRGYTAGTFNIIFTTSSGNGSAAQGTLTISNGIVGALSVVSGGTSYTAGDVLTASGGSGLQVSVGSTDGTGAILTLGSITNAGIGYTAGVGVGTTTVSFLGGTGSGAVGLATIFDGVITSSSLLQQPITGTGGTVYYSGSNYSAASVLSIDRTTVTNTITVISGSVGVSTLTSLTAHGLFVNDIIRTSSTSNGLTAGTDYYVVTTPDATSFTLGTSIGVGITFTTGSSLALGFYRNSANAGGQVAYTNAITGVSTNYQVSDLLVLQNGINSDYVEYGTIANNDVLGTFATDISGGNARLLFTPTYPNNTIKVARQAITL